MRYRFGDYDADRTAYRVERGGQLVNLTPKLLDLLFCLLDKPGELVTKEALLDTVWPGANVTDNAMAQAVSDLREALGDSAASPTYIKTISRRGYRFIAPVERDAASRSIGPGGVEANGPRTPPGSAGANDPHATHLRTGSNGPTTLPGRVGANGPATAAVGSDTGADGRTLAVPDFANLSGDPDVQWLGAGIAESLSSDLASLAAFRVVDRWRVLEAVRQTGSVTGAGAAVGARLVVAGSFQRHGPRIRITARLLDLGTGAAMADVKVDGQLEDIFSLQDAIGRAFARDLGHAPPDSDRGGVRETSNLEAYRAYMEGWLKVESMDVTLNASAVRDFERAIAIDPKYAIAYSGLANAEFIAYDNSRATPAPNFAALRSGIEHARYAVHLGRDLAEAHATLSFLLTCAHQFEDARRAAQQAVSLEPGSWRHQYRLGHALWGEARLRAFERALALYPQFAYARLEMAMVHIARGQLDVAMGIVRQGAADQDRQVHDRFPAVGFHWLLGALRASRGDAAGAIPSFDRELELADPRRLYRSEYAAAALISRGHAQLALGQLDDAAEAFAAALTFIDRHPRALIGLAVARERLGKPDADRHFALAEETIAQLRRPEREAEWLYASACAAALRGNAGAAVTALDRLLDQVPLSYVGWTIPIEPALAGLHGDPGFRRLVARLAERAR
jgi:DNA-binding winged helix-turn-helix (wHTH) protein/TolB-like protein/tetratricopeptide (TPR) repeat protein